MGKKVHYKLHKVKKQWVTIAVTSAALASIVGGATVANQKVQLMKQLNQLPLRQLKAMLSLKRMK